jgi:hypothetical protein
MTLTAADCLQDHMRKMVILGRWPLHSTPTMCTLIILLQVWSLCLFDWQRQLACVYISNTLFWCFHLMLLRMVSSRIVRRPYSSFTSSQLSVLVWAFVRVVYARVQHTPKSTLIYPLSKSKLVSKTFQPQAPILRVPTFIPCPCGCKLQKRSQ